MKGKRGWRDDDKKAGEGRQEKRESRGKGGDGTRWRGMDGDGWPWDRLD